MDIICFLRGSSTSVPSTADTTSESSSSEEGEIFVAPANKKAESRFHNTPSSKKYQKRWETDFLGWNTMLSVEVLFVKYASSLESPWSKQVGTTKPFNNWKKAVQKMRDHAGSDQHSLASQQL